MNFKEKWNKWKNAKYMWDISRISVMIDANDNSWVGLKEYEYLTKRYKSLYFSTLLLMVGILVVIIALMGT